MKKFSDLHSIKVFRFILVFSLIVVLLIGTNVSSVFAKSNQKVRDQNLIPAESIQELPSMNAIPINNKVDINNLIPETAYTLTLYQPASAETPIYTETFSVGGTSYPCNDFEEANIQLEPHDKIVLMYYQTDIILTEVIIADIIVTDIDLNTELITGTSDQTGSIEVVLFTEFDQDGNPVDTNSIRRTSEITNSTWSVDFSIPQGNEPAYDITSMSQGIIVQQDTDLNTMNCTMISWWSPNPEVKIDPLINKIGSSNGWRAEVNLSIYAGSNSNALLYTSTIVTNNGAFDTDLTDFFDILGGQRIVLDDGMINRELIVSSISVTQIDAINKIIYGYTEPYGYYGENCNPDVGIMLPNTSNGDSNACILSPIPDSNGYWIADFSGPQLDFNGNPCNIVLDENSFGFVRQYDGHNDGTWVEWKLSDFLIIPGDLNHDMIMNNLDAQIILKYLAGKLELTPQQLLDADYNQDGIINKKDAQLMMVQFGKGHKK